MSKLLQNGFQIVSETEMMMVAGGLSYDDCFAPPHVAPEPVLEPPPQLPQLPIGGGSPEHYLAE